MKDNRPAILTPSAGKRSIPRQIKRESVWSVWRKNTRGAKIPLNIHTGGPGDPTSAKHFGTIKQARELLEQLSYAEGLALRLSKKLNVTCFDFDRVDRMSNRNQQKIFKLCQLSYTEISQSGKGVHVYFCGRDKRIKRSRFNWGTLPVEIYTHKRFIAFTGLRVASVDTHIHQYKRGHVEKILGAAPAVAKEGKAGHVIIDNVEDPGDDYELLERAAAAGNGEKFSLLWDGHWQAAGEYSSQSEADLALAVMLCFHSDSFDQQHRMLECSPLNLYREKKKSATYLGDTISQAHRLVHNDRLREFAGGDV